MRRRAGAGGGRATPEDAPASDSVSQSSEPEEVEATVTSIRDAATAAAAGMPARKRGAAAAARAKMPRLESFSDMPDYLRDNEFIFGSYRPQQSLWSSLRTLWGLHNETGNVWTHLLGFLLFLGLALWFGYHPPAPLAITVEHTEHLWGRVQGRFAHLQSDLAQLEGRVSDGMHALSDRVTNLGADVLHGMHLEAVAAGLSEGLHGLQEGIQHRAADLQHGLTDGYHRVSAALNAQLQEQLSAIVQWPMPRWPVYVYFAGACVCLLTSCVCHLLGCCQRHISQVVWRFDYAGIAVLIVASFYPAVYYSFLCQPFWRNFYLITTTVAGAAVIAVSLPNHFQATHYRTLRACVFSALGLWGIVPVAHQLCVYWDVWAIRHAFQLDLLMGVLYLMGATIYASRVPERWMPGKLDLIGHSHQLWHITVVLAALVHYKAILVLLQWRDASGGCAAQLHAHVPSVLRAIQTGAGDALAIDQVWQNLSAQLHEYVGMPAAVAPPIGVLRTAAA